MQVGTQGSPVATAARAWSSCPSRRAPPPRPTPAVSSQKATFPGGETCVLGGRSVQTLMSPPQSPLWTSNPVFCPSLSFERFALHGLCQCPTGLGAQRYSLCGC